MLFSPVNDILFLDFFKSQADLFLKLFLFFGLISAWCFLGCSFKKKGNRDFKNIADNFPALNNIKITTGAAQSRIQFICTWESNDTSPKARFEVTWYQGLHAQQIPETNIFAGNTRRSTFQNTNDVGIEPIIRLGTVVSNNLENNTKKFDNISCHIISHHILFY